MVVASAVGVFVVAAVLIRNSTRIWKRMQTIETQLNKLQKEITTVLQVQTALIRKLNAKSKAEIDPPDTAVEIVAGDVAGLTMSPSTTPAQPESARSAKLPE